MSDDVGGPGAGMPAQAGDSTIDALAETFGGVGYWFGVGVGTTAAAMVVGGGLLEPVMLFGIGLAILGSVATYGVFADD